MSIVKRIAKDLFHGSPHSEFPILAVSKVAAQIDCPSYAIAGPFLTMALTPLLSNFGYAT